MENIDEIVLPCKECITQAICLNQIIEYIKKDMNEYPIIWATSNFKKYMEQEISRYVRLWLISKCSILKDNICKISSDTMVDTSDIYMTRDTAQQYHKLKSNIINEHLRKIINNTFSENVISAFQR